MSDDVEWRVFRGINARRRAVRDFDGKPIDEGVLREVVEEALKAPSSANLQPFQFHLVTEPQLKARVAEACNGQRAAATASALVVVVSSLGIARRTLGALQAGLEAQPGLSEASRTYHAKTLTTLRRFLRFAPWAVFSLLRGVLAWIVPALALFPIGRSGSLHWLARNSIFATQTLLLAASARGIDTCPMEGFNAVKISRALQLPRGSVVPVVVALGHRTVDARIEPQLRRPLAEALVVH